MPRNGWSLDETGDKIYHSVCGKPFKVGLMEEGRYSAHEYVCHLAQVVSPTPEIGQGVRMGDIEKSKVDTMTMEEVAKRLAALQAEHDKLKAENTKLREDSKVREPLPATSKFEVKGKRMTLGFDLEEPKPSKAGKASIRYAQSWRKVGDYTVNLLVLDAKRKS